MNTGPILVIGELVTDVIARINDPIAVASDTRAKITMVPGGAGGNVTAWLAELGSDVTLVACVGDDPLGRSMEADLEARGATPRLVRIDGAATGSIVVLVDAEGERTMLTDAAPHGGLAAESLPEEVFDRCRHLHLSGYVLLDDRSRDGGRAALQMAREAGMTTSLDPSSAALLARFGVDAFLELTKEVDVLLPAYDEGRELARSGDVDTILSRLLGVYDEVALTLGADGAIWAARAHDTVRVRSQPLAKEAVDMVGAGDAFVAGWLRMGAAGGGPTDQLEAGCAAGARAVTTSGAWPGRA